MYALKVRNVNEALAQATRLLMINGQRFPSRVGEIIEFPGPLATVYLRPRERVLFDRNRDANPFFHFFEALWMLAGRGDAEFVTKLLKRMIDFSDDGKTMQGAYGWRWRSWFGPDQLQIIIDLLRKDPHTRRAVLAMWDPIYDLENITSKDIPCNTHIYFKARLGDLHMTVCNRSNDMIFGAYGANVVHMSMLHEYVASKTGLRVGEYVQMSDSFHVYTEGPGGEVWAKLKAAVDFQTDVEPDPYSKGEVSPVLMEAGDPQWDLDLNQFFMRFETRMPIDPVNFETPFFRFVVTPMWKAFTNRDTNAAHSIAAPDWRRAALEWLDRRKDK